MNLRIGCAALAVALLSMAWLPQAQATIIFNVGSLTLNSDGINPTSGTVDVFLTTDNPGADVGTLLGGFQAHVAAGSFTGSISGVTFGVPTKPSVAHPDQFPAQAFSPIPFPPDIAGGSIGAAAPFVANSGLMTVPFTVAVGQSGSFTLSFVTGPPVATELYDAGFSTIGTNFQSGTITINAVPEPSTIALGALGLIGFAGARWRRRRKAQSV